jgi:hypothetical protein
MQTDDIAAWLTAIWDERQRACADAQTAIDTHSALAASGDLELRWMLQLRRGGEFQGGWDMPGPPTPAEDLARIAADREILALHYNDGPGHDSIKRIPAACAMCGTPDEYGIAWPCKTVRLLALPYADRPGYQEAWRPERLR